MQEPVLQNQDVKINHAPTDKVIEAVHSLTQKAQPFEVVNKVRGEVVYKAFSNLANNLHEQYHAAVTQFSTADFIIYKNERHSFISLYMQASQFAHALKQQYRVLPGDRIVISMRNYPEWIAAFIAITSIGAVAVPLNAWWTVDEVMPVLNNCNAKLAIVDDKRFDLLHDSLTTLVLPIIVVRPSEEQAARVTSFAVIVDQFCGKPMPEIKVDGSAVATIFYTSGSTGVPKGAVSSHESILTAINTWVMLGAAATKANTELGIAPPTSVPAALMTVPLFHVTGCHTLFLLSMVAGRKTVMMEYWDAETALKLIEREKITYFNGVPTMSMELMNHPTKDHYDLSSLADICAGGAARPPEHVRKIYDAFQTGTPSCGYGLTETNALGAINGAVDYIKKTNSAGLPTPPVVEVKVIDENGQSLIRGEVGEIAIKTFANILGYWRNSEATEAAFDDGYFKTGDLGYLDKEGFLYVVDRAKDIIIRGGENISCFEVESILYKYREISEVCVFSLPDERLGEVVGALVYTESDLNFDQDTLSTFCARHLAQFKIPQKIWITKDKLPRLGSGKIDKPTIKQFYQSKYIGGLSTATLVSPLK